MTQGLPSDIVLAQVHGYLQATLGTTRNLSAEDYRNRIRYVVSLIEGAPDPSIVANEPPIPDFDPPEIADEDLDDVDEGCMPN